MHVVIVGCGRVGSSLAHNLVDDGHTVAIIDRKSAAFERLRPGFSGEAFAGIGFDRDLLVKAGIERADALAPVTNGDNSNILVARVARETFGIERVVARIYDPRRAAIYQRLGVGGRRVPKRIVASPRGQVLHRVIQRDGHPATDAAGGIGRSWLRPSASP